MGNEYNAIASIYDEFRGEDPKTWAEYIDSLLKKYSSGETRLLLDLGCGTGTVASALIALGYDLTGVDSSEEMLALAQKNAPGALLLHQDMRSFELYGTIDAAICCMDGINYLSSTDELLTVLKGVALYLNPEGLFIFDVNTRYKFETVYGDNDFILESKNGVLCWSCKCKSRGSGSKFYLSYFRELKNGLYERLDEEQTQRLFTDTQIRRAADEAGFDTLAVYDRLSYDEPTKTSQKIHYILKKKTK